MGIRRRLTAWGAGVGLLILHTLIDLKKSDWMSDFSPIYSLMGRMGNWKIGPDPFAGTIFFTLLRALIYALLIQLITRDKAYSRLFFLLHWLLFTLSGVLYAIDKFTEIPVKVNNLLFLLTNTPTLFLAFLPAYYYIFKPTLALEK